MTDLSFINNKTVLVTGHTGFKGSWLSKILIKNNAKVIGYSLNPPTEPNLFSLAKIEDKMISITGDIRDYQKLFDVFKKYNPEYVIHLAAQPIVRFSYRDPKYTYETNVLGTVNVLECIRNTSSVKSFLNVTTDKVYFNDEKEDHLFTEEEKLDGFDPYSNSKSCSELVTHSYKSSFFSDDRDSEPEESSLNFLDNRVGNGYIVSSSKTIKKNNDNPPCQKAKNRYIQKLDDDDDYFKCTEENEKQVPVVFEIKSDGIWFDDGSKKKEQESKSSSIGKREHLYG